MFPTRSRGPAIGPSCFGFNARLQFGPTLVSLPPAGHPARPNGPWRALPSAEVSQYMEPGLDHLGRAFAAIQDSYPV